MDGRNFVSVQKLFSNLDVRDFYVGTVLFA